MILAGERLGHRYAERVVLYDVSIGAAAGEVVGLIGPNGAGKSTCFRLLAGVEAPLEGSVRIGDRDVTRLPIEERARLGLGYLPQEPSVFRGLSAVANVTVSLEAKGVARAHRAERALEVLAEVGLEARAAQRADRLSGGERRRLEVARLLALEPKVLLLDEPFTGLDPIATASLRTVLERVAGRGVGILLTDHNASAALAVCSRAMLLLEGKIALAGPPGTLRNDARAREMYLGEDP